MDENEEEADHQDTDIKPFPSSPFLITSLSQDGGAPVLQSQCFKSGGKLGGLAQSGQGVTKGVSSTEHRDLWQPGGVYSAGGAQGAMEVEEEEILQN